MNLLDFFKKKKINPSKRESQKFEARRQRLQKVSLILWNYNWLNATRDDILKLLLDAKFKDFDAQIDADWIMRNLDQIVDAYCAEKKIKRIRKIFN